MFYINPASKKAHMRKIIQDNNKIMQHETEMKMMDRKSTASFRSETFVSTACHDW